MANPPKDGDTRALLERLRNDPRVIVRRRRTDEPCVPQIRVLGHVDVLDLLDRCKKEDEGFHDAGRSS